MSIDNIVLHDNTPSEQRQIIFRSKYCKESILQMISRTFSSFLKLLQLLFLATIYWFLTISLLNMTWISYVLAYLRSWTHCWRLSWCWCIITNFWIFFVTVTKFIDPIETLYSDGLKLGCRELIFAHTCSSSFRRSHWKEYSVSYLVIEHLVLLNSGVYFA